MNPSQALKQKIEAMADDAEYQHDCHSAFCMGCCNGIIRPTYVAGAQSLVPLVESLVKDLETLGTEASMVHQIWDDEKGWRTHHNIIQDALTNYRKFIGG